MADIKAASVPIGIANEDGTISLTMVGLSAWLSAKDLETTEAGKAMQTLPRIVQRAIYRFAKWRLR